MLLLASLAIAAPNQGAFEAFVAETKASGTTALYIEQDGRVLVDWRRGPERPAQLMSCTKSIVAILVYQLRDEGRISSFDRPLSDWYPEIAGASLASVTLRDLLAMTSGLEPCADTSMCPGYGQDVVELALRSPRTQSRGTWEYSNNAVNLLSGVIERVTGGAMDAYADEALFTPLGITTGRWQRDSTGTTPAASDLALSAHDLARVGAMLMAGGSWLGNRILSEEAITEMTRPQVAHPWYAHLWWPLYVPKVTVSRALLDFWERKGVPGETVAALAPLAGSTWPSVGALVAAEKAALGGGVLGENRYRALALVTRSWDVEGVTAGYAAEGYLGQYLVVLPSARVVAVRQRAVWRIYQEHTDDPKDLPGWPERVAALFSP